MNKQHGGTILGFIIGLVVGLAVAVIVALMITKTSSPFTNKLGMTKNQEGTPIQLTDPNKPLYGNAYKEPSAAPDTENSASGKDTKPAPTAPITPDAAPPSEAKSDVNNTKATDSVPAKTNGGEKAAYYLQVGAFRDISDAESIRAKLALLGIESVISEKTTEADNLFRVRIGPFDQLDVMNRMRSKLSENSIDVAVIKTPK